MSSATAARAVRVPRAEGELTHRQILVVFSGLMMGLFLAALDQTIVATSITRIANDLDGLSLQAWATTTYMIMTTITTPLYGKLSDLFGRKPLFLIAISIFTVGSLLCTLATSMYSLAGFRALQGLGAGGLFSLVLAIIGDLVPPRERARYQGYFLAVFGLSSVVGPLVGGTFAGQDQILGIAGWRWVFLVNVPVALAALVVITKVLHIPHTRREHRLDLLGAGLLATCLVPILLVCEQGREWGWTGGRAWACYLVGASALVAYVFAERRAGEDALIPLRLFRNGVFSLTSIVGLVIGMALFGGMAIIPQYLQIVKGATPTRGGLLLIPLVIGIMVSSVTSGQITGRTGRYRIFPILGTFFIAASLLALATIDADTPLWRTDIFMFFLGLGLGGCLQTLLVAVQNVVPPRDMGVATASTMFFRQMGGALATAVFLSVLFSRLTGEIAAAFAKASRTPEFRAALADPAVAADPHNAPVVAMLNGGGRAAADSGVLDNAAFIRDLDPRLARPFLEGFAASIRPVFLLAGLVAVVGFVLSFFIREVPLRAHSGVAARLAEERAQATGHAQDAEPPVPAGGPDGRAGARVRGAVRSGADVPVVGAALTLIDLAGRQVCRARSGDDGAFALPVTEPGAYLVIASAAGHRPEARPVTVGTGDVGVDFDLAAIA